MVRFFFRGFKVFGCSRFSEFRALEFSRVLRLRWVQGLDRAGLGFRVYVGGAQNDGCKMLVRQEYAAFTRTNLYG